MGALQAKENIWYVGVQDPGLRVFDIIMHSDHGTSYNSYIVKGTEKTVLFETSKEPFFEEFLANIREVCDPASLDYIVVNHTEPDHTGSMKRLLELAPGATVLGSGTALTFLKEIVNGPFPSRAVTEKDEIDLGGLTMKFLSVPMLHWPDSMYTYIPELKALFTCAALAAIMPTRAYSTTSSTAISLPRTNIISTTSSGRSKTRSCVAHWIRSAACPWSLWASGHGPVLRSGVQKYFDMYRTWCRPEQRPEKVVAVAYVSAYGYTRRLAEHIRDGLKEGGVRVEMYDLVSDDTAAAKAAVAAADGFLLGSPTLVGDALPPVYEMFLGLNPIIHKGKPAGAFGSYGWSGEAVPNLTARMQQLRLSLPLEGMRVRFCPTQEDLAAAVQFGRDFAKAVRGE